MKSEASSLYILQDGTQAYPGDCSKGQDGVLRHKNGLSVAMGENGEPLTVGYVGELNAKSANAGPENPPADAPVDVLKTEDVKPVDEKPEDKPAKSKKAD